MAENKLPVDPTWPTWTDRNKLVVWNLLSEDERRQVVESFGLESLPAGVDPPEPEIITPDVELPPSTEKAPEPEVFIHPQAEPVDELRIPELPNSLEPNTNQGRSGVVNPEAKTPSSAPWYWLFYPLLWLAVISGCIWLVTTDIRIF